MRRTLLRAGSMFAAVAILLATIAGSTPTGIKPAQVGEEKSCCDEARELSEAVKDQQKLIDLLQKEVDVLKKQLAACTSALDGCKKGTH
jgi:hypothetical protein